MHQREACAISFHISHLPIACILLLATLLPSPVLAARKCQSTFDAHLYQLEKSARKVGVEILSLTTGQPVFEYRVDETFIPASLVKVLTSYSALKMLGPEYRFPTSVWSTVNQHGDDLPGSIWVKSDGDIFLSVEDASALVRKVKELGLNRIDGDVYVDNGYFAPQTEQICLDGNCASSYNPVISATSLDFNTITLQVLPGGKAGRSVRVEWVPRCDYVALKNLGVTVSKPSRQPIAVQALGLTRGGREIYQVSGRVPLRPAREYEYRLNAHDPASFLSHSMKAMFEDAGIAVKGAAAGGGSLPRGARRLAVIESRPLGDLLYGLNRYSNNFMAEMLLRSMGAVIMGKPGTAGKGLAAVQMSLRSLGVPENEVNLDSGSGLSRECRVSPRAFGLVLAGAYRDPSISSPFLASLAVNGEDGTLRNRMCGSGATIRGKTGTLSNVAGFAGYVSAPGEDGYVAVVLLNGVQNLWQAREAMDSLLQDIPLLAPRQR
jgi:D-alanyl-D-alanine carboxypeptidase/D-alanyl-D-alanine-endopeptidase (penicillin-binding protein 4)